jgi:uncharacterized protein YcbX
MSAREVGRIAELWRYPVKSMQGERVRAARAIPRSGIAGDRGWAVRDEKVGEIRGAKYIPALLQCRARYLEEPSPGGSAPVEIELPGGERVRSGDADVNARLSRALGREVTLWPLQPPDAVEHYRRRGHGSLDELRDVLGLVADEPLPEFGRHTPAELAQFVSRPGTYFDAHDLHLLSGSSLARLASAAPQSRVDVRRFRPNALIDAASPGQPELDWCDGTLRIGTLRVRVLEPMLRCSMTVHAQSDLPRDPRVMRALVRETAQRLGVSAAVEQPGELAVGAAVWLE